MPQGFSLDFDACHRTKLVLSRFRSAEPGFGEAGRSLPLANYRCRRMPLSAVPDAERQLLNPVEGVRRIVSGTRPVVGDPAHTVIESVEARVRMHPGVSEVVLFQLP